MVCYAASMTDQPPKDKIKITVNGKVALTVEMIAKRWGITPKSVSVEISRRGLEHDSMLDGKKKLYLVQKVNAVKRPGKGWRGKAERP